MAELSVADQIKFNNLDLNSMLMQNMLQSSSSKVTSALQQSMTSNPNMVYATEGDSKYDEDIDTNSDGTITYNEYVKYVTEQNLKKYNLPTNSTTISNIFDSETGASKTQILNLGKALSAYLTNSALLPKGIISREI